MKNPEADIGAQIVQLKSAPVPIAASLKLNKKKLGPLDKKFISSSFLSCDFAEELDLIDNIDFEDQEPIVVMKQS